MYSICGAQPINATNIIKGNNRFILSPGCIFILILFAESPDIAI
jgi:hypothetical protein